MEGIIIKINSDLYTVNVDNQIYEVKSRGKLRHLIKPLVGDHVLVNLEKLVIEEVLPRNNYLERPSVANIDIALIVTSLKEPDINFTLLDKLISIITINNIEPVIVLTKLDLVKKDELKKYKVIFKYYEKIGILVFDNQNISKIKKYLSDKIVTVTGQTGAGKSTLINKFDNNLNLLTDTISYSLNRGKHTTRITELFQIDDFYIVDTPGFSQIDISKYNKEEIKNSFLEFRSDNCAFRDCYHLKEKKCFIKEELEKGNILLSRYENYKRFIEESK